MRHHRRRAVWPIRRRPPSSCSGAGRCRPASTGMFERRSAVDAVLRRLRRRRVGHAVLGIEPEGRRDLRAAGQRSPARVGDVALGQADAAATARSTRPRASGSRSPAGCARRRCPGSRASGGSILAHRRVGRRVAAGDLHVDRRGQPEVQDLAVMSAGRKEKVVPGKRSASARAAADDSRDRRWPSLSVTGCRRPAGRSCRSSCRPG